MGALLTTMEKADVQRLIWWLNNVDGAHVKFHVNTKPVIRIDYDFVTRECETFASAIRFIGLQKRDVSDLPDVDMNDIEWMIRWISTPTLRSIECSKKGSVAKFFMARPNGKPAIEDITAPTLDDMIKMLQIHEVSIH